MCCVLYYVLSSNNLQSQVQGHVVVVATATNPDHIHSILRRAGRFDKEVELTVPTVQEREEVGG